MVGYNYAFADVASARRLLADSPQTLKAAQVIANPSITAEITTSADAASKADVVADASG